VQHLTHRPGIPSEILHFFRNPGGHSLIVKGSAGTGKTTFALQLTEELGGIATSFYMSTRVSDESLYNQFPWLRERMKQSALEIAGRQFSKTLDETTVLTEDATDISFEFRVRGERKRANPEKRRLGRTELEKLEGRIEMGEEGDETYAKHGEGQVSEGTLVFDLGTELPEIDMAYDAVERNLPNKTLILIDSINALAERYGIHPAKLITTLQKDLVEDGQANVVFILEDSGETKLDYLGDGVVLFQSREHAGRRLRLMTIEKLRATELRQHKFIYSLEGARVRAFDIRPVETPGAPKRWKPVPDLSKDEVSTGNEALDALIGGVHRARIMCLEFTANVPWEYIDNFRLALICNFASLGRGVAHVPPRKGNLDLLRESVAPHLEAGVFDQNVRVYETTSLGGTEVPKGALHMEGSNVDTDLKWSSLEYHLPKSQHPFLSLLSFDTLEAVYGPGVLEQLSGQITAVRRQRDLFIGFTTPLASSSQKLASMAFQHVRVENLDGSIVLYGEKPHTELYNVSFSYAGGVPKAVLTPIV
jgi:KaiC/GvpD/RAD55 family RecA-like ATPase